MPGRRYRIKGIPVAFKSAAARDRFKRRMGGKRRRGRKR